MRTLVLLSGGMDSAACVAFYRQLDHDVAGVFIDYGQPVREQEQKSANAIAAHYSIPLTTIRCIGPETNYSGEIVGRNAFLVFGALLFQPIHSGIIALGVHSGTTYYDCSDSFTADLNRMISGYTDGQVTLGVPFVNWDKPMIHRFAVEARVPVSQTWSCEVGPVSACGKCLSCLDRERLGVCSSI